MRPSQSKIYIQKPDEAVDREVRPAVQHWADRGQERCSQGEINMSYEISVKNFMDILDQAGIPYSTEHVSDLSKEYRDVFSDQDLREIRQFGYIGDVSIKWPVEQFYLYPLASLLNMQEGYRVSNGVADTYWDQAKYVIGDWVADPVSIDKSGRIWYAVHGEGEWNYDKLSNNLEEFIDTLRKWIKYFSIENKGKIENEQRRITPEKKMEVQEIVLDSLDEECKKSFIKFLFS